MKKYIIALLFSFFIAIGHLAYTQPPPPSRHGESGDQPAQQDTPIGGGLAILAGLGIAYGAGKVYGARKTSRG